MAQTPLKKKQGKPPTQKDAPQRIPRKSPGLDLQTILNAAWKIVDEGGVDALTIRSLAAELHVQGPALYWHVKNKDALLSLMIEQMLVGCVHPPEPGEYWADWLKDVVIRHRDSFLQYRNSGLLTAIATPTDAIKTELHDLMVSTLTTNGVEPKTAHAAVAAIASFTLGWIIYAQKEGTRQMVIPPAEQDAGFEKGLNAIIAGFTPAP